MKSTHDLSEELEKLCQEEFALENKSSDNNSGKLMQIKSRIRSIAQELNFSDEELAEIKADCKNRGENKKSEMNREFELVKNKPYNLVGFIFIFSLTLPHFLLNAIFPQANDDLITISLIFFGILASAAFINYYRCLKNPEIKIDSGKDIYFKDINTVNYEKLDLNSFKYVKLHMTYYPRGGAYLPKAIVFSNLKNIQPGLFSGNGIHFGKDSLVFYIDKIKSAENNIEIPPYVLSNLIRKQCRKNKFNIQDFETLRRESKGWSAEKP